MTDNYQPLNNFVLVKITEEKEKMTDGGVLLSSNTAAKLMKQAEVLAASEDAQEKVGLNKGDVVLVHKGKGIPVSDDENLLVYEMEKIISKVL